MYIHTYIIHIHQISNMYMIKTNFDCFVGNLYQSTEDKKDLCFKMTQFNLIKYHSDKPLQYIDQAKIKTTLYYQTYIKHSKPYIYIMIYVEYICMQTGGSLIFSFHLATIFASSPPPGLVQTHVFNLDLLASNFLKKEKIQLLSLYI